MQNIRKIHQAIMEIWHDTHLWDTQTDTHTDGHDTQAKTKASRAPLCAANNLHYPYFAKNGMS